jgi:preprotein translocase subunit SecG
MKKCVIMFIFLVLTLLVAVIAEKQEQQVIQDDLVAQKSDMGNRISPLSK